MDSEKRWGAGSNIWMAFLVLMQWLMPLEYWTKPITASSPAYQNAAILYTVVAIVSTALILWLWISKGKVAFSVFLIVELIDAIVTLIQSGFVYMLLALIVPFITWLILRKRIRIS